MAVSSCLDFGWWFCPMPRVLVEVLHRCPCLLILASFFFFSLSCFSYYKIKIFSSFKPVVTMFKRKLTSELVFLFSFYPDLSNSFLSVMHLKKLFLFIARTLTSTFSLLLCMLDGLQQSLLLDYPVYFSQIFLPTCLSCFILFGCLWFWFRNNHLILNIWERCLHCCRSVTRA